MQRAAPGCFQLHLWMHLPAEVIASAIQAASRAYEAHLAARQAGWEQTL